MVTCYIENQGFEKHMKKTVSSGMLICIATFLLCFAVSECHGQTRNVRDSVLFSPCFQVHGGIGTSAGDLGLRYGRGGHIGAGAHVKTSRNWFLGGQASFGFGLDLKELGVLSNLLTPTGQLIDNEGQVALITLSGKGGMVHPRSGKVVSTGQLQSQFWNPDHVGWRFRASPGSF
jgi:hypothetical protein